MRIINWTKAQVDKVRLNQFLSKHLMKLSVETDIGYSLSDGAKGILISRAKEITDATYQWMIMARAKPLLETLICNIPDSLMPKIIQSNELRNVLSSLPKVKTHENWREDYKVREAKQKEVKETGMVILKKWLPLLHAEIPKMNYNSESSLMKLMIDLMDPETINIGRTHYEFARSIVCHSEENRYLGEDEDLHIDTPLRLEIVNRFPDLADHCETELIKDIMRERLLLIPGPNINKKEKRNEI